MEAAQAANARSIAGCAACIARGVRLCSILASGSLAGSPCRRSLPALQPEPS